MCVNKGFCIFWLVYFIVFVFKGKWGKKLVYVRVEC